MSFSEPFKLMKPADLNRYALFLRRLAKRAETMPGRRALAQHWLDGAKLAEQSDEANFYRGTDW